MTNSVDLKHCVGLILKSIQVLFQWKDFESSDTDDLFLSIIIILNENTFYYYVILQPNFLI